MRQLIAIERFCLAGHILSLIFGLAGLLLVLPNPDFIAALPTALFLTAWDFVLDPAMSQTAYPFWEFYDPGQFFGMPYRNLTGWLGTGVLFMSVAAFFWRKMTFILTRSQLMVPLVIYLVNFAFGAMITLSQLDRRFWIPTAIGVVLGVIPAVGLWWVTEPYIASKARESFSPLLAVVPKREFF